MFTKMPTIFPSSSYKFTISISSLSRDLVDRNGQGTSRAKKTPLHTEKQWYFQHQGQKPKAPPHTTRWTSSPVIILVSSVHGCGGRGDKGHGDLSNSVRAAWIHHLSVLPVSKDSAHWDLIWQLHRDPDGHFFQAQAGLSPFLTWAGVNCHASTLQYLEAQGRLEHSLIQQL